MLPKQNLEHRPHYSIQEVFVDVLEKVEQGYSISLRAIHKLIDIHHVKIDWRNCIQKSQLQ